MKPLYNTLRSAIQVVLVVGALLLPAQAQEAEQPGVGFFNVINTIPRPDPLFITVQGYEITEGEGLACGDYTGKVGFKEGSYNITFTQKDCEAFTAPINLKGDKTPIIYVFAIEETDEETGEVTRKIQAKSAPSEAKLSGYRLGVLNSSNKMNPLSLEINDSPVSIENGQTSKVKDWDGRKIALAHNGEEFFSKEAMREGSYICVVFDRPEGQLGAMVIPDSTAVFESMKGQDKKENEADDE